MKKEYLYDIGLFVMENEFEALSAHMCEALSVFGYSTKTVKLPPGRQDVAIKMRLCDFMRNGCIYQVFFVTENFIKSDLAVELAEMAAGLCRESGSVRAVSIELGGHLPVSSSLILHTIQGEQCGSLEAAREIDCLVRKDKEQAGRAEAEQKNCREKEDEPHARQGINIVVADQISNSKFF